MISPQTSFWEAYSPNEQERYNQGFEDAYNSLAPIVKKLGKKHYKEFLLYVKSKHNNFYTTCTTTFTPQHECNCDFCELNDK